MRRRGIPTTYRSVRFRSILEARYAALFDLAGLEWAYEPLETRGYIPDFIVGNRLLCEVRPIAFGALYDDGPLVEARVEVAAAAAEHGYAAAVLGATPTQHSVRLFVGEQYVDGDWRDLHFEWRTVIEKGAVYAQLGEALGRIPTHAMRLRHASFEMLWREAGSRVQWRRKA